MKKCPYCGHENDPETKNCDHCHAALQDEEKEPETEPKVLKKKIRS